MQTATVEVVRFDSSDIRWAKEFATLARTAEYGLRKFPEPYAYHEKIAQLKTQPDTASTARLSALAQRDWHMRGQNGCQFARLVAKDADTMRWDYHVLPSGIDLTSEGVLTDVNEMIAQAVTDAGVEVASILVPQFDVARDAVDFIRALTQHGPLWLERDELVDGQQRLFGRYPIDAETQAWVMAFAPFAFMPNTRRGPHFELAIRVKPKPDWVFHRSSQEREIAHLADTPLTMSDQHWEDRWWSTKRRTEMILGATPDDVSAAKATLTVPVELLE